MPRRLLALNVLLVAVAALAVLSIVRTLTVRAPDVAARPRPTAPAAVARPPEPAPGPAAYNVVAVRNLFSPTRTEAPSGATQPAAAVRVPKPLLFGIVLRDGQPIAYLEDPVTKRVAGYRVGDSVAGGTLQKIAADSVVLNRPEGAVDVRLRDPSKPRPAAPVTPPRAVPPRPGAPTAPPTASPYPGAAPPQAVRPRPGVPQRPLPPNLLRRIPPGPPLVAPPPPPDARQ